jgi:hypothetical protein
MQGVLGKVTSRSIVTLGLPPPPGGPEDPGQWYHEALQMPKTRVTGYFGVTMGSDEADGDVQLFFHEDDHLKPTLRLVISQDRLLIIFAELGALLHKRLGLLKEWNLTSVPSVPSESPSPPSSPSSPLSPKIAEQLPSVDLAEAETETETEVSSEAPTGMQAEEHHSQESGLGA